MNLLQAGVLGVVEGLTEFLPVSSTGHLTVVEKLLGFHTKDNNALTAFTAVIQVGAIVAAIVYFRADIVRIVTGWFGGLRDRSRRHDLDYRMGWYVIVGTIPIGIVGLAAKPVIEGPLRSLWAVVAGWVVWSAAMVYAERRGSQRRPESATTMRDAITIGVVQCIALVPGVSRSGATISAGLVRGLDRVTATRLSFFLAIPALVAAGAYELKDALHGNVGAGPLLVGTAVSFVVAYVSIAWLLRFVASHSIARFVPYRLGVAVLVAVLLLANVITSG